MPLDTLNNSRLMSVQREKINRAIEVINKIDGNGDGVVENALNAKNAWSLTDGVEIPKNADLNTYTEAGNYFCSYSVTAQSLTNTPIQNAFVMKVFYNTTRTHAEKHLTQQISGIESSNTFNYERKLKTTNNGSSWTFTEWRAVLTDKSGKAVDSGKLDGKLPSYYATKTQLDETQQTADNAMPKGGGSFIGDVIAITTNRNTTCVRNIVVKNKEDSAAVNTNYIKMIRK